MWWALRLYFAGFDDLMPVVGGSVWVFHNVIPVVKLLTVTVPTKLNLPPKNVQLKLQFIKFKVRFPSTFSILNDEKEQ